MSKRLLEKNYVWMSLLKEQYIQNPLLKKGNLSIQFHSKPEIFKGINLPSPLLGKEGICLPAGRLSQRTK